MFGQPLIINDTPFFALPNFFPPNYVRPVTWKMSDGKSDAEAVIDFEDAMVASSADCPGITVLIQGYFKWTVNFTGSMGVDQVWVGGGLTQGADATLPPVSALERGPANSKLKVETTTGP